MSASYWGVNGTVFSPTAWCTCLQVGSRDVVSWCGCKAKLPASPPVSGVCLLRGQAASVSLLF